MQARIAATVVEKNVFMISCRRRVSVYVTKNFGADGKGFRFEWIDLNQSNGGAVDAGQLERL